MNILLIKYRHIGDVLLSTPLIDTLAAHYPGASIDMALNADTAAMVKHHPRIGRLFPYDRSRAKKGSAKARLAYELAYARTVLKNRYDLVINLTEGDRGALMARLSGAPRRLGLASRNRAIRALRPYTDLLEELPYIHTVERTLLFAPLLEIKKPSKRVSLYHPRPAETRAADLLRTAGVDPDAPYVVVHPVSRWMFKCWDDRRFAQVIDAIALKHRLPVVITASPDPKEMRHIDAILSHCRTRPLNLAGRLDLDTLSALLKNAALFLGVDTAPMHMAAAHDVPVLALFGASDPVLWGPWDNDLGRSLYNTTDTVMPNGRHTVIRHPGDRIVYRDGEKISTAMMAITPDEVMAIFDKKVARWVG